MSTAEVARGLDWVIQHSGHRSLNNLCMHGLRVGEFKAPACLNFLIGNFGHKPLKNLRMQGLKITGNQGCCMSELFVWHLDFAGSFQ